MDYIPCFVPLSTTSIPSNEFLMTNPPHITSGTSKRYDPFGYIVPLSFGVLMCRCYMHPQVLGGHPVYQMNNYGYMVPHSQGMPHIQIPMHPYMSHMGGGYYPTCQGHGLY